MKRQATEKEYQERFWTKVDREKSNTFYSGTRCWEWNDCLTPQGYGQYYYNGKMISIHRYSYFISFGKFDSKLFVLHHCDNKKCVNPNHLFLGTHLENMQDMNKKGRRRDSAGEKNGQNKLTEKQVVKIYEMYHSGDYLQKEIGKIFGVDNATISRIIRGKRWSYLFNKLNK